MSKHNMSKHNVINEFNVVTSGLFTFISKFYNDFSFDIAQEFEAYSINNPEEPIANFVMHIYKNNVYKNGILGNDIDFILHIDETESIIFSFILKQIKDIWKKLEHKSKLYIMNCLRAMIKISSYYVKSI